MNHVRRPNMEIWNKFMSLELLNTLQHLLGKLCTFIPADIIIHAGFDDLKTMSLQYRSVINPLSYNVTSDICSRRMAGMSVHIHFDPNLHAYRVGAILELEEARFLISNCVYHSTHNYLPLDEDGVQLDPIPWYLFPSYHAPHGVNTLPSPLPVPAAALPYFSFGAGIFQQPQQQVAPTAQQPPVPAAQVATNTALTTQVPITAAPRPAAAVPRVRPQSAQIVAGSRRSRQANVPKPPNSWILYRKDNHETFKAAHPGLKTAELCKFPPPSQNKLVLTKCSNPHCRSVEG